MLTHLSTIVVFACCAIFACPSFAQERGATKVYKDQFIDLHARVQALLQKSDETLKSDMPEEAILELRGEVFALTRLVHRLGEESGQTNIDRLKKEQSSSKTLLLVASGCEELSFILGTVDDFLETKDRTFLELAKRGEDTTQLIERLL